MCWDSRRPYRERRSNPSTDEGEHHHRHVRKLAETPEDRLDARLAGGAGAVPRRQRFLRRLRRQRQESLGALAVRPVPVGPGVLHPGRDPRLHPSLGTDFVTAQHIQFANVITSGFVVVVLSIFGLRRRLGSPVLVHPAGDLPVGGAERRERPDRGPPAAGAAAG